MLKHVPAGHVFMVPPAVPAAGSSGYAESGIFTILYGKNRPASGGSNDMYLVKTRRHPLQFYTVVSFTCLLFFGTGLACLSYSSELLAGVLRVRSLLYPVLGAGMIAFAFATAVIYSRRAPIVCMDRQTIRIGKQVYYLKDITCIRFTGKQTFRYLFPFPMEGMQLQFANGGSRVLFDDMYTNTWLLKAALEQAVVRKQDFRLPVAAPENAGLPLAGSEQVFKGATLFRYSSLLRYALILCPVLLPLFYIKALPLPLYAGLLLLLLFLIFTAINRLYYFGLTDELLVIRNPFLCPGTTTCRLADIRELVLERQPNQPCRLRIITHDFKTRLYRAGSLSETQWRTFQAALEQRHIRVRNECI